MEDEESSESETYPVVIKEAEDDQTFLPEAEHGEESGEWLVN